MNENTDSSNLNDTPDNIQPNSNDPGQSKSNPHDPAADPSITPDIESDTTRPSPASLVWAIEFLPDYFSDQPAEFHCEMLDAAENPDRRLIARVAPRGHAKSTCAAFAYPLWCICERKKTNIIIITFESSLAVQFVRDIRNELETNEQIISAYGDLCTPSPGTPGEGRGEGLNPPRPSAIKQTSKPRQIQNPNSEIQNPSDDPSNSAIQHPGSSVPSSPKLPTRNSKLKRKRPLWTQEKFTTNTNITVQAKSAGASLRGVRVGPNRPDLIICDDIEKDETVETAEGRRKLEHWLRRVVMPALAPNGQLLVLGSLIHHDSLLANLRHRSRFRHWHYRAYRAMEPVTDKNGKTQIQALWPARWPLEKLREERERIGTLAFEQEYQANPIDDSIRVFRPEWLRRYKPEDLEHLDLVNIMAVDPATGSENGDYFALWIGSIERSTGTIFTRRLKLERIDIVQQVKRITEAFLEWNPIKIGIETNAYQIALKHTLEDFSRRSGLYMPIVGLNATANKRARIEGTAPFYEQGIMRLPELLDPEIELQFLDFPKARHDDAPDVCAMGIELARNLRGRFVEGAVCSSSKFHSNSGSGFGSDSNSKSREANPNARNPYSRNGGW